MQVSDILDEKGRQLVTIGPDRSVRDAARMFVRHGLGALPVVEAGSLVGMISERDALRVAAREDRRWGATCVADEMTEELFVVRESDDLDYAMEVMTEKRVRHLPVVEDSELRGLISIGDAVKSVRRPDDTAGTYRRYYRGRTR